MKTALLPAVILLATLATLAAPAHAAVTSGYTRTTYHFTGTMEMPFGTITVGTPFEGTFTYNSAQELNIVAGTRGEYTYENFTVNILGQTLSDNGTGWITINNGVTANANDTIQLATRTESLTAGGIPLLHNTGLSLYLTDRDATLFNDLGVLKPNYTLADFGTGWIFSYLQFIGPLDSLGPGTPPYARGSLTSLQAVPETSTLLGTLALGGLAFLRRRR